jgi:hypothetical protein
VVGFEVVLGALLAAFDGGVITSIHGGVEQRHGLLRDVAMVAGGQTGVKAIGRVLLQSVTWSFHTEDPADGRLLHATTPVLKPHHSTGLSYRHSVRHP